MFNTKSKALFSDFFRVVGIATCSFVVLIAVFFSSAFALETRHIIVLDNTTKLSSTSLKVLSMGLKRIASKKNFYGAVYGLYIGSNDLNYGVIFDRIGVEETPKSPTFKECSGDSYDRSIDLCNAENDILREQFEVAQQHHQETLDKIISEVLVFAQKQDGTRETNISGALEHIASSKCRYSECYFYLFSDLIDERSRKVVNKQKTDAESIAINDYNMINDNHIMNTLPPHFVTTWGFGLNEKKKRKDDKEIPPLEDTPRSSLKNYWLKLFALMGFNMPVIIDYEFPE